MLAALLSCAKQVGRRLEKLAVEGEECAVRAQAADADHAAAVRRQKRLQKSIASKQQSVDTAR